MNTKLRNILLSTLIAGSTVASAQDVLVYLKTGGVRFYPSEIVKEFTTSNTHLELALINDSVITYDVADIDSISHARPADLPVFTSFKFNNKYNDQVFTDVIATVTPDSITATVGAIGKWLTPSFQVSDESALVWVDGTLQTSKQSRLPFNGKVIYTIGYDNWQQLTYTKIKDEVWSEPTGGVEFESVVITEDQLSTNAPSNRDYSEGVGKIVDGNTATFFHSTWGTGEYEKLPLDVAPYIDIALEEGLDKFVFGYSTRFDTDSRMPQSFLLQASHDGEQWMDIKTYTAEDGIPQYGVGQTFESDIIRLEEPYEFFRLTMLSANYKNYLCLSEFWIKKVVYEGEAQEPTLISPAQYEYVMKPFGRDVAVNIAWPSDTASVPAIYIDTDAGILPPDKETYLTASIRIDGAGVYPDFADSVNIKGRGNTSWAGQYGKSPYRLKFNSSKKPFGLTKGKSWVLLANRQTGSMLSNAVAMKIASMVETAGANRVIPVELYINGEYRGSYNFTQHVGLSNNSIDLDDETNAVLLELDSYYDEDFKFKDNNYTLPVNVKDPDLADDYEDPEAQFNVIKEDFNKFTSLLSSGTDDFENSVDETMLARFLLVNELVQNLEIGHPKSTFLYKEDLLSSSSKYVFGPVWDFDWAFGYEKNYNYCTSDPTYDYFPGLIHGAGYSFFNNLRYNSELIKRAYYKEWKEFMDNQLSELLDYVETYYQYANPSFENNYYLWYDGNNYEVVKDNTINWLKQRAQSIFENLEVYDLDTPTETLQGDANLDGYVTVADVVTIINRILELPNESFSYKQADLDNDNEISINDAVIAIDLVLATSRTQAAHLSLPKAEATLKLEPFMANIGEEAYATMSLKLNDNDCTAFQFDLTLPEHTSLQEVQVGNTLNRHKVEYQHIEDNNYRIVVYSPSSKSLELGQHDLTLVLKTDKMLSIAERRVSTSSALLTTTLGEDLRMSPQTTMFDVATTSIANLNQNVAVEGGKSLTIESLHAGKLNVYTLDGRCIRKLSLKPGKQSFSLPCGVYIVGDQKVVIQ